MEDLKIAVVGCGVAGLAAAAFLRKQDYKVTLFESFDSPVPLGAGLLLQPTGLSVLAKLGLEQQILDQGSQINQLYGRVPGNRRATLDVRYSDFRSHLFGIGIHRGMLFSILFQHVLSLDIEIRTGFTVDGVSENCICNSDGESDGPFDLIVDASGSGSRLRNRYAAVKRDRQYPFGALWTTLNLTGSRFAADMLEQRYKRASQMVGVLPAGIQNGEEIAAFFWSMKIADFPGWLESDLQNWKDEVLSLWPETTCLLEQIQNHEDLTLASYRDVVLARAYDRNLVFIGDSAHCTSPQLGQGANLALVDALVLAESLARQNTLEQALCYYNDKRKNHVQFYQLASRWLTPFFQSDSWAFSKLRFLTCDVMCQIPFARTIAAQVLSGVKSGPFSNLNPGAWQDRFDINR